MFDSAEMAERHARVLAELSELGLTLARDLQARALVAETPEDAAGLANAFHRISRSVRQTLALEARLERDRKRAEREDFAEAQRQDRARVEKRSDQVRASVERLIWTEYEEDEAERLIDDLGDLLAEEALYDGFTADPVEAHIARICEDLGLPDPPLGGRWPGGPEVVDARSGLDRPASQPPQSRSLASGRPSAGTGGGCPLSGGASGATDHPWRSSA